MRYMGPFLSIFHSFDKTAKTLKTLSQTQIAPSGACGMLFVKILIFVLVRVFHMDSLISALP